MPADTPPGFAGTDRCVHYEASEGAHVLRIVSYAFADGSRAPFVEASETHDGARRASFHALSTVVHLLQNVGEMEAYQIGNREHAPAAAPSTGGGEIVCGPGICGCPPKGEAVSIDAVVHAADARNDAAPFVVLGAAPGPMPGGLRRKLYEAGFRGGDKVRITRVGKAREETGR